MVRRALITVTSSLSDAGCGAYTLGPINYLHLTVKLFLASSGGYDPIVSSHSGESVQAAETNHFSLARDAVDQSSWAENDIHSTRDYLCHIFEVDGTLNVEEAEPEEIVANFMDCSVPSCIITNNPTDVQHSKNCRDVEHIDMDDTNNAQGDPGGLEILAGNGIMPVEKELLTF
jgi:hypothetical protein